MNFNRFDFHIIRDNGWWSGDIRVAGTNDAWTTIKASRTRDGIIDNAAEWSGPNAIIITSEF